jgi:hypothetical protein
MKASATLDPHRGRRRSRQGVVDHNGREDIVLLHSLFSKHDRATIENHAGVARDLRQGEIALDRRRYDLQQLARLVEILKDRV